MPEIVVNAGSVVLFEHLLEKYDVLTWKKKKLGLSGTIEGLWWAGRWILALDEMMTYENQF